MAPALSPVDSEFGLAELCLVDPAEGCKNVFAKSTKEKTMQTWERDKIKVAAMGVQTFHKSRSHDFGQLIFNLFKDEKTLYLLKCGRSTLDE